MHAHHPSTRVAPPALAFSRSLLLLAAVSLALPGAVPAAGAQQPLPSPGQDTLARRDTAATMLKAVTVVAAPAERAEPRAATHVNALTVRQTPANSPYDLLRQTAGVEVHQQGQGPGFASDASLRGFSSDHSTDLALWVDGVPVNEPVNGHAEGYNDWDVLFPGGIQDIDVIRGPTSALFGNFALAGVVNVRTVERMRGTQATVSGGSFGRVEGMLMTGFDHGAAGGGVLGLRFQRADGFRPNDRYDVTQGHARLVHDLAPGVRIDGGVELYGGNWVSPGFLSEDEFVAHRYDVVSNASDGGFKRRAQERVSLSALLGNALWRTTVYSTQGRWQLYLTIPPAGGRFEGSGSQTEEEDHRYGFGATTALTWSLPRGEVTLGGESRWDHSHYENYFTTARTRDSVAELLQARQLSGALFLQSHVNVTDRLRVDAGARLDELDTRSTPDGEPTASDGHALVSPKLGALLRLTPAVGVYANVSRGFRSTDGIIEDPTLPLVTAWSYEGGLKLDHRALTATATLFRMDVSNEQTFNPVTLESTSGGSSRRQGVELELRAPVTSLFTVDGDWTFLDARYRSLTAVPEDGGGPPEELNGLRVYNTARYVGTAALEITPPSRNALRLRVSGNWVGPYSPFDEPGALWGSYGLLHASASARIHGVELEAGVRNLLDRAYPELVAGHIVSPGQPRALFARTTYTF
ncbi:MAG TPA: TonB-dependent receptor [Gemmatimonadaceae bacterium]|nr:TonB-dependent receptor [Gemmatimonadaceae bacterium]